MLNRKESYSLIKELSKFYNTRELAIMKAEAATELTITDVPEGVAISVVWQNIIDKLLQFSGNSKNYLLKLLEYIRKEDHIIDNDIINNLYIELDKGLKEKIVFLVKLLKQNQLNLCIGQNFLRTDKGIFLNGFSSEIIKDLEKNDIFFDNTQKENLYYLGQQFLRIRNSNSADLGSKLKIHYTQNKHLILKRPYDIISELPFKSIINFNYDNLLHEINPNRYETLILPEFQKFNPTIGPSQRTKLFSFLGNLGIKDFSEQYSILSESELIKFICDTLINRNIVLDEISNFFDSRSYCLFLGFDFSHWYIKFLFSLIIKIKDGSKKNYSFHLPDDRTSDYLKHIFEDEFHMIFIDKENQSDFLELLIDAYTHDTV